MYNSLNFSAFSVMFHIIDDNGFIREIMFEILKDFGHQAIARLPVQKRTLSL